MKGRAPSLSELSAERLELCATRLAEFAEKVDRSVIRHFPKLKEGLVRYQIRIDDPSSGQLSTFDDLWRGQDSHPADLYVKLDHCRYVRLVVLERVDVAFRSRLDEFLVEFCRRSLSCASHCAFACACWLTHDARTDVSPPMVAPASAARAEISDAFIRTITVGDQRDRLTFAGSISSLARPFKTALIKNRLNWRAWSISASRSGCLLHKPTVADDDRLAG